MEINLSTGSLAVDVNVPDGAFVHGRSRRTDRRAELLLALKDPIGLPLLQDCIVPGDRLVLVVDPETPDLVEIITAIWEQFQESGREELDATLLMPPDSKGHGWKVLLEELPVHVRNQVAVHVYDPAEEQQRRYLANSAGGERIYLSHYLTDADLVVTIGVVDFDLIFGCRGTNSSIYPAFSEPEAFTKVRQAVGMSLTPTDKRPVRDLVDEIGWLLGTQFAVQVIPGAQGERQLVLCGAPDEVMKAGREILDSCARISIEEELDLAVVTIPGQSVGGWKHLGTALQMAKRLVGDGGRIAVVADLSEPPGQSVDMIRRTTDPEELLDLLRQSPLDDSIEAIHIIEAVAHTTTYLLSNLDASFVEDLGMLALADQNELQRVIDNAASVAVIHNANYVWSEVAQAE